MPPIVTEDVRKQTAGEVRQILGRLLPGPPRRIEQQGGGLNNFVFAADHDSGEFIVRLTHHGQKLNSYLKERWAMSRAAEVGVPVPEVLDIGDDPVPYMVMRKTAGHPASVHPHHVRIIRSLGRCAALINSLRTEGFGGRFDPHLGQISGYPSWGEYLREELNLEERLRILGDTRMFDAPGLERLRNVLSQAPQGGFRSVLNHGDLRLKNVIVDDEGRIQAILDWESCSSNLGPQWELSLALHDLSVDSKQEFLHGYGLRPEDAIGMAPLIKALNVINYAPHVKRAVERNDSDRLEWYRLRFSGALDLYSV